MKRPMMKVKKWGLWPVNFRKYAKFECRQIEPGWQWGANTGTQHER
jgi:hypothetical protein